MSDTPRDFTITLAAATAAPLEARGRFFGIIESPAGPLDVQFDSGAPLRRGAGGSILLPRFFKRVTITSVAAQTIRVLVSDEPQDVSNIVAGSGGGGAVFQEQPSAAIIATASAALATANSLDISANAARRRITICNESLSAGAVWIRDLAATTNAGIELQPGTFVELKTIAAIRVRNNSGVSANISTLEET